MATPQLSCDISVFNHEMARFSKTYAESVNKKGLTRSKGIMNLNCIYEEDEFEVMDYGAQEMEILEAEDFGAYGERKKSGFTPQSCQSEDGHPLYDFSDAALIYSGFLEDSVPERASGASQENVKATNKALSSTDTKATAFAHFSPASQKWCADNPHDCFAGNIYPAIGPTRVRSSYSLLSSTSDSLDSSSKLRTRLSQISTLTFKSSGEKTGIECSRLIHALDLEIDLQKCRRGSTTLATTLNGFLNANIPRHTIRYQGSSITKGERVRNRAMTLPLFPVVREWRTWQSNFHADMRRRNMEIGMYTTRTWDEDHRTDEASKLDSVLELFLASLTLVEGSEDDWESIDSADDMDHESMGHCVATTDNEPLRIELPTNDAIDTFPHTTARKKYDTRQQTASTLVSASVNNTEGYQDEASRGRSRLARLRRCMLDFPRTACQAVNRMIKKWKEVAKRALRGTAG